MTAPALQRLGDFEILRELGRGGMGVVYEARQLSLNRKVALKVLAAGLGLTARAVERFQREAEAAAKLHHSNIVPVYATGEQDGQHFYAMELIEGPSLDHVLHGLRQSATPTQAPTTGEGQTVDSPYPQVTTPRSPGSGSDYFDTVARQMADVAEALDHAHSHGVIHRDIKPSNLLLAPDGRLSLNDFGLARVLEQPGMTHTGEFLGTPAYMSPEQITAGRTPLDQRTDIYSLGATLYEMLTLQRPFAGERREQVLAQILYKEPVTPRRRHRKVPMDLETICLKCLEKDPDRRYQSGKALAEDLRRFVQRQTIAARRVGPLGKLVKWVRRRPGLAAALGGVVLAIGLAGYFAYRMHAAEQQRLVEQRQSVIDRAQLAAMGGDFSGAEEAVREAERLGASAGQVRLLRGQIAHYSGKPEEALQHFKEVVQAQPDSVAALALLALGHGELSDWKLFGETLDKARRLPAITAEDYLFLGHAEAFYDPDRALPHLEEALRRRPSVIARLVRADVLLNLAMDRGDADLAERSARDADLVKQLLPDNPLALTRSVEARNVAAQVYATGQPDKRVATLALARTDVRVLEQFPQLRSAVLARWSFLRSLGEQDAMLDELARYLTRQPAPELLAAYAVSLYRRGEFQRALQTLEKGQRDGNTDLLLCLVRCELPDGQERVLQLYQEIIARPESTTWDLLTSQMALLLLGRLEQSREVCRDYRRRGLSSPTKRAESQRALAYLAGALPAEDYIQAASTSRVDQNNAHFFIGLTRLAEGDRPAAREHFRKGVQTGAFHFIHFDLCWVLLGRLESDPTWPKWLPSKKGA